MRTLFDDGDRDVEDLSEGSGWLCDLIAAVDFVRRGARPGLTVWDAFEEALRWHLAALADGDGEPRWDDPDPLGSTLSAFVAADLPETSKQVQQAVRRWVTAMAAVHNDGHHWPHPIRRRAFPPPLLDAES